MTSDTSKNAFPRIHSDNYRSYSSEKRPFACTMAPAIKVKMRWEVGTDDSKHFVIKLKVPKSWRTGPISKLKETFIDSYNAKHGPASLLHGDEIHMVTGSGKILYDSDIVEQNVSSHDDIHVKEGAPPERKQTHWSHPAVAGASRPVSSTGVATTASGHSFSYSKWDNLDVSDEEEDGADCHPNIDKKSWVRLKQQKREEERAQQKANIERLTRDRDEKKARLAGMKAALPESEPEGADEKVAYMEQRQELQDMQFSLDDAEEALATAIRKKKWTADELCEIGEEVTMGNPNKDSDLAIPGAVLGAAPPPFEDYDSYVKKHMGTIRAFALLSGSYDKFRDFLWEHPELLSEHVTGYLLLLCLDYEMDGRRQEAKQVAHNYQIIQFCLELAMANKWDARDAVQAFFRRVYDDKDATKYVKGFKEAVLDFMKKLVQRAKDKKAAGEESPLKVQEAQEMALEEGVEEEEGIISKDAPLGPGGLHPQEVFDSLPEKMQECFAAQDIPMLQKVMEEMDKDQAAYHLKRCIDSGLRCPG